MAEPFHLSSIGGAETIERILIIGSKPHRRSYLIAVFTPGSEVDISSVLEGLHPGRIAAKCRNLSLRCDVEGSYS